MSVIFDLCAGGAIAEVQVRKTCISTPSCDIYRRLIFIATGTKAGAEVGPLVLAILAAVVRPVYAIAACWDICLV